MPTVQAGSVINVQRKVRKWGAGGSVCICVVSWLGFLFVLFYFLPTHVELLDLGFWKLLKSNL